MILLVIAGLCAVLSAAWLALFLFVLIAHGGAYTRVGEDGMPILSVTIFPDDDWLRSILLLFGLPLALLTASTMLAYRAARRLVPTKLP